MNQDDRVETGYYVRNMDNFYRGAEDVLIWVGLEPRCVDYGERRSPPVEDISWWHYANSLNGRGFNGPGAFGPCIWARQGVDPAFGIALVGGRGNDESSRSLFMVQLDYKDGILRAAYIYTITSRERFDYFLKL
ncbi:hypothetical protein EG327_003553 [Venturia inaequalis]|uniref:Uncharacterized protein n=1 Tax=Venturia inaequalis TaxID=5025 RepID=A0A8H3Z774_VENIN|nr:hypothetical protein EG327_003553 [Venturia inaequalis]